MKKPKMRKRTATPRLRAGIYTAYDVMKEVLRLGREEKRRIDMGWWVDMYRGKVPPDGARHEHAPACGTVACLGGWGNIITGNYPRYEYGHRLLDALFGEMDYDVRVREELDALFGSGNLPATEALKQLAVILKDHKPELQEHRVRVFGAKSGRLPLYLGKEAA